MITLRHISSPVRRRMRARLPLCRPIERWLGRRLTPHEDRIFYALQDMRRRHGYIRMMVCDPYGVDSRRILLTYMAYLVDTYPHLYSELAFVAPSKREASALAGTTRAIARRKLTHRSIMRRRNINIVCAGSGKQHALRGIPLRGALLMDADCYMGLRNIHCAIVGALNLENSVYIIHSHTRLYVAPIFCNDTDFRRPPPAHPPEPVLLEITEHADEDTSLPTHELPPLPLPEPKPGAVPILR